MLIIFDNSFTKNITTVWPWLQLLLTVMIKPFVFLVSNRSQLASKCASYGFFQVTIASSWHLFFFLILSVNSLSHTVLAIQKINTEKTNGYMANLVNLRSVTCYTDQNFKSECSFRSSKYLHLEKRFKESYKTSISLEDLDVDFVLQHFNQCLFVNQKPMIKLNHNLIIEEDSIELLEISIAVYS